MTTGRINQVALMSALQLSRGKRNLKCARGKGQHGPHPAVKRGGEPVFYSRFCSRGDQKPRFQKAYQCESFTTVNYPTAAKRPGCFLETRFSPGRQAALMLLPFQSTDPEQRVNWRSRLPRPQAGRARVKRRPRIPLVHQSWMARSHQRVTGT